MFLHLINTNILFHFTCYRLALVRIVLRYSIHSLITSIRHWLVNIYPTMHRMTTSFFLSAIFLPSRYEIFFSTDLERIYLNPWNFIDICEFHLQPEIVQFVTFVIR